MADEDGHREGWQGGGETTAGDMPIEAEEGPGTDLSMPVRRGIAVYREMLRFEQEMLTRMRSWAVSQPEAIRRAVHDSDIEPMELLVEQFRDRLAYWQERERQLGKSDASRSDRKLKRD